MTLYRVPMVVTIGQVFVIAKDRHEAVMLADEGAYFSEDWYDESPSVEDSYPAAAPDVTEMSREDAENEGFLDGDEEDEGMKVMREIFGKE